MIIGIEKMYDEPSEEQKKMDGIWKYFLSLESDLQNTNRYVDPDGQENVYSDEFARILILSCVEFETVVKDLFSIENGNIKKYKEAILSEIPGIVETQVSVKQKWIKPFEEWQDENGKIIFWSAYTDLKHNRVDNKKLGTYKNAEHSLSALYILILYYSQIKKLNLYSDESTYITSNYAKNKALYPPIEHLP